MQIIDKIVREMEIKIWREIDDEIIYVRWK